MKKIENYDSVQASSGEFAKPEAGGYICKIVNVKDVPYDEKIKKGDYLIVEFDIADGDFKGYYMEQFSKFGGNWNGSFIRSYKDTALGMLKHFTNTVMECNPGYEWDWNEAGLIGKVLGLVLGEEEYINKSGETKTKLAVKEIKSIEDIKNGNYKIPPIKRAESKPTEDPASFEGYNSLQSVDDDLPF